jgi:hypothetical protein
LQYRANIFAMNENTMAASDMCGHIAN